MLRKVIFYIPLLCILCIITSCKKKNESKLILEDNTITFSDKNSVKDFVVSNSGNMPLSWKLDHECDWLSSYPTEGEIDAGGKTEIRMLANRYQSPGKFESMLYFTSNGGDETLHARFDLDFDPSIYPGLRIDQNYPGITYKDIQIKHGYPNDISADWIEEVGVFQHLIIYNTGIGFYFFTYSANLAPEDQSSVIAVVQPYKGVSEMNIGLGTSELYVTQCYGEHEDVFYTSYGIVKAYLSKGIDFAIHNSEVVCIWIYPKVMSKEFKNSILTCQSLFSNIE